MSFKVPQKKMKRQSSFGMVSDGSKSLPVPRSVVMIQKGKVNPFLDISRKENKASEKAFSSIDLEQSEEILTRFKNLLAGKTDNLPHLPRSVIRIFISSTFSDMRAERNILSREVFPKLKELCLSKDLDFQVVDMRWGVTEDSQNDHSVERICLQEVENCQQMSLGPNFVAIIGDRYGFRPVPIEISEEVFKTLKEFAQRITTKPHAVKLMETWYKLDENCLPPKYILQPIRSQFSFFGDYSPGCDEPRAKHTQEWENTFADLRDILKTSALLAHDEKKITNEQLHEYNLSVTEIEIKKGILEVKCPDKTVAVFERKIQGFTNYDDGMTKRHIDTSVENGKAVPDKEVKYLQGKLKEKLKQKVDQKYIHEYSINWLPNGIDPAASEDHKAYLDKFCENFYTDLKNMIEDADDNRGLRGKISTKIRFYTDYSEILHHLHFCELKCRTFCGQKRILDSVKAYILDTSTRKPFVIYAPSGHGKTSVMAMIMQSLPDWFKQKSHVRIIRFLGTSALTLNIYDVLRSVCGQVADVADLIMEPVGYKKIENIQEYMPRFFRRVSNSLKKPVVILLDSLDQLLPAHKAYDLQWLPTTLPQNFKLVVSTLPKEHGILDNLRAMLPDKNCYVEIPTLPQETGVAIIKTYLLKHKRKVTEYQEKLLMSAFSRCPGPLFLKIILDEALKWRSYTLQQDLDLQQTVQGAINKLFDNLEIKFGKTITSHALGYITIARDGISENELEDVLSCDDEALDDVYRYHNPPVDGIVRIPPVLAARIRFDIKDYIVERISHDKYTMNWYHRQFIETARNRYATGSLGEKLHRNLVEIFMSENGVKRDITLSRRKLTVTNADRQITPQPVTCKNKRMLSCLPYHIIHAGKALSEEVAKENYFCHLRYISSKLSAFGVETMVDELYEYLENQEDEEIKKLRNFLSLTKKNLSKPSKLASNILAFINDGPEDSSLKKLKEQAINCIENQDTPGLIPEYPGLAPRKDLTSSLIHSYNGIAEIICSCGDSVLVKTCRKGKVEENEFPYELFHSGTEDLQQVSIPDIKEREHYPLMDKAGENVIYTLADSITLLHLITGNRVTKMFKDITDDPSKNQMVCKELSTDTSHLAVLMDDGDVVLLNTDSLMQVDRWSLKDEVEDVMGVLCTKSDNLQVLVSVNTETGGAPRSELQLYKPGDLEPKRFLFNYPLSKGLQGLSFKESFFTAVAVDGGSTKMLTVDINQAEEMAPITLEDSIKHIVFSKSKPIACALTSSEKIVVLNLQKSEVVFDVSPDKPVSYFGISGTYNCLLLGDEVGSIHLYNAKTGVFSGGFPAHSGPVEKMQVLDDYLISHGQNEMKVWSLTEILTECKDVQRKNRGEFVSGLLGLKIATCFDLHPNGLELVTASKDQMLQVWMLEGAKFSREIGIRMEAKKMVICADDKCCLVDSKGELRVIHLITGLDVDMNLPSHVLDFVIGKDGVTLYTIGLKQDMLMISVLDLKLGKTKKSFPLKGSLKFETMFVCLSASERYLCIQNKILPSEFKDIEASWKKNGSNFNPQVHPYKFVAVDLQQATGGLMVCLRKLSNIPYLGEKICAFAGNIMAVTINRRVIFWDMPTGRCDQKVCKSKNYSMMYRPRWLENPNDVKGGSKAMEMSKDGHFLAVGSEDGYLFIYHTDSGIPVREKAPATKHTASVIKVAISGNSKWVVSACQNNTIKLWDTSSGKEVFTTRVDAEVQHIKFTPNSKYVVILTGTNHTRVLIYKVHTGSS
ncbi:NACHT domain- and WD repeat-containing protein 1-like isoform X1 [Crassostrea angulata]|uniref:NACHT domain- and WD repeat-containing protein 1-like isoform X1 n=1 Tax=Magallana angulata TaxID=2784310 RepID=UPI0022B11DB2|nr:NACHT domain- and WD repeat-containing protein 1-like isoform X1 [Crassostrea angulata]